MRISIIVAITACALLLTTFTGITSAPAAKDVQSGPDVGTPVTSFSPFTVANAERPDLIGRRWDYVDDWRRDPVVLVFARELNDPLKQLLAKLDAELARHKTQRLHVLLLYLSDEVEAKKALKGFAEKNMIHRLTLAADSPQGPAQYRLAKEAEVTVVMYVQHKVRANFAYRKGELGEEQIKAVLEGLTKILPPS